MQQSTLKKVWKILLSITGSFSLICYSFIPSATSARGIRGFLSKLRWISTGSVILFVLPGCQFFVCTYIHTAGGYCKDWEYLSHFCDLLKIYGCYLSQSNFHTFHHLCEGYPCFLSKLRWISTGSVILFVLPGCQFFVCTYTHTAGGYCKDWAYLSPRNGSTVKALSQTI